VAALATAAWLVACAPIQGLGNYTKVDCLDDCADAATGSTDGPVTQSDGAPELGTVRVEVTGLAGTGLVLANNGGDPLAVPSDGGYAFSTKVARGGAYRVTVQTQPVAPPQSCTTTDGAGTVTGSEVTVHVVCVTDAFSVGGRIVGLRGTGLVLVNNGGDAITVSPAVSGDTPFTFPTKVASGQPFDVTVRTPPSSPLQTCSVNGGQGTVAAGDVASVTINCSVVAYTIGGTVSGLSGTGLVLRNGGDTLAVNMNGSFAFGVPLAPGATYSVGVATSPTGPSQSCAIANASGTMGNANVTNITVTCTTNSYTVGGMVSGLVGAGLVLRNGADNLAIAANGAFTLPTPVLSGQAYSVTAPGQPTNPWQTCTVANATGTVGGANVTNVTVTCTTNRYTVGGTVTGLSGTVVLQNNLTDNRTITTNGTFTFATSIASGQPYSVTVLTQPSGSTCFVTSGSGTVTSANITSVSVQCSAVDRTFDVGTWLISPWAYAEVGSTGGSTTAGCAHDGAQGLSDPDWAVRTDVTVGSNGQRISLWTRQGTGRIYLGFGATLTGAWSLVAAPNTSSLIIQQNASWGFADLASSAFTYTANRWYRLEVQFGNAGMVTGVLYDMDGTTQLATVSATLAGFAPGGIALRGFSGACMDTLMFP
jgi:hypothetical protein